MERNELLVRLSGLLHGVAADKLTHLEVVEMLGKLLVDVKADDQLKLMHVEPATPVVAKQSEHEQVYDVFAYWQKRTGHAASRLLPDRAARIRARLRHFTVAQLKAAVDGVTLSAHHMGENSSGEEYNWIETIFKTNAAVEHHMSRAQGAIDGSAAVRIAGPEPIRVSELREEIASAKRDGDLGKLNRLNGELRNLLQGPVARSDGAHR